MLYFPPCVLCPSTRSPYKSVRSRLTHLMGSDIARINDRSYMTELESRLCQWHRDDINR